MCEQFGSIKKRKNKNKKSRIDKEFKGKMRKLNTAPARYVGATTDHTLDQNLPLCISTSSALAKELHRQNISERLYKIFDRIGKTVSGYNPDIRWCTNSSKCGD